MTITEKVAYLKGLAEGMALNTEANEGKLISVIIDTLEDMALEIEELSENTIDLGDELDAISDDLADVEEILFGSEEDDEEDASDEDNDACCCCSEDECCDDDDEYAYEVTCPSCGEDIIVEEADLENGDMSCPNCGEKLEFEFDEDDSSEDETDKA